MKSLDSLITCPEVSTRIGTPDLGDINISSGHQDMGK